MLARNRRSDSFDARRYPLLHLQPSVWCSICLDRGVVYVDDRGTVGRCTCTRVSEQDKRYGSRSAPGERRTTNGLTWRMRVKAGHPNSG